MRRTDVKMIIAYYCGIPAMRELLERERCELEDKYNGLRGTSTDTTPHSSTPGDPTEKLAEKVMKQNVWNRIEAITVRDHVLESDQQEIQDCLDMLKCEYKRLIFARYRDKYSWAKIGTGLDVPDRTVRRWHDKAVDRLGEALDEAPMMDELLDRASHARV